MRTLLLFFLLFPSVASATTVTFDAQDFSAGIGSPFVIAVNATAEEFVTAFDIRISIPEQLRPLQVSDGNSIIVLWLDQPRFDEATRVLSFSGIIPNGFRGEVGRLLSITVEPTMVGEAYVTLLPESRAFVGEGKEESLPIATIALPVIAGKENLANVPPDEDSPESFVPEIVSSPFLFGGVQAIAFSTTDKGSGIAQYQIKESWFPNLFPEIGWRTVESPVPLKDQHRSSYVFVRALDQAGNERIETIPPERLPLALFVIPLILIVLLIVGIRLRRTYANP